MRALEIDATEATQMITYLKERMTPRQFTGAMYGVFNRTGKHVRAVVKKDIPHKYAVTATNVASTVGRPRVQFGSMTNIGCTVPIEGARLDIGSGTKNGFKSRGSAPGFAAVGRPYKIKAKIYAGGSSTLPAHMPDKDGGHPPFQNSTSGSMGGKLPNNLVFTREASAGWPPNNLHVNKVVGIAIPQMPLNKAEPEVQEDIAVYVSKTLASRIQAYIKNGR